MSRRAFTALFLLLCFLNTFTLGAVDDLLNVEKDFPLLAVSKKSIPSIVSLGSSSTIEVTILNMGEQPAYDVELVDRLINGTEVREFVSVLSGKESYTTSYTVLPTMLGNYPVGRGFAVYNIEQGNPHTRVVSTSNWIGEGTDFYRGDGKPEDSNRGNITVLTTKQYNEYHSGWLLTILCYMLMGVIPAFFPYVFFRMKRAEEDVLLKRAKSMK